MFRAVQIPVAARNNPAGRRIIPIRAQDARVTAQALLAQGSKLNGLHVTVAHDSIVNPARPLQQCCSSFSPLPSPPLPPCNPFQLDKRPSMLRPPFADTRGGEEAELQG